jgi:hypothetical protein
MFKSFRAWLLVVKDRYYVSSFILSQVLIDMQPPLTLILSPDGRGKEQLPRSMGERAGVRGIFHDSLV